MPTRTQTAWDVFGSTAKSWSRVRAIVDYVYGRLRFDYKQGNSNQRRIGRIVMAYGRDDTDCEIATSFSPVPSAGFTVQTDEIAVGG